MHITCNAIKKGNIKLTTCRFKFEGQSQGKRWKGSEGSHQQTCDGNELASVNTIVTSPKHCKVCKSVTGSCVMNNLIYDLLSTLPSGNLYPLNQLSLPTPHRKFGYTPLWCGYYAHASMSFIITMIFFCTYKL